MKNKKMYIVILFLFFSFFYLNVTKSESSRITIGASPSVVVNKVTNSKGEINVELSVINKSEYKVNTPNNEKNKYNIKINLELNKGNSTVNKIEYSDNNFILKPGENKKINIKAYSSNNTDKESVFYIDVIGILNTNNSVDISPIITIPIYYIDNSGNQTPNPEPIPPTIKPENPENEEIVKPPDIKPETPKDEESDNSDDITSDDSEKSHDDNNNSDKELDGEINESKPNVTINPSKENNLFNPSQLGNNVSNFIKDIITNPIKTFQESTDKVLETLFYKPIQLTIKDLMVYDITKTKYETLMNTIVNNESILDKNRYNIVKGNQNFDLLIESIDFSNKSLIFNCNKVQTEIIFPNEEIMINVKNQIQNLSEILENQPTIKYLLENLKVPKDKNYQPIKIKLEAIIENHTDRTIFPTGQSTLIDKNRNILATSDFQSKIISPNDTDIIYSEIQVDSNEVDSNIYSVKNNIQVTETDTHTEEKSVVFVSIRKFIYLLILISIFWIVSLTLNNIKSKSKIKTKQSRIESRYNKKQLEIETYVDINTDFFFNYADYFK